MDLRRAMGDDDLGINEYIPQCLRHEVMAFEPETEPAVTLDGIRLLCGQCLANVPREQLLGCMAGNMNRRRRRCGIVCNSILLNYLRTP